MKTFSPTPEDIKRTWYTIDATGQVLGRLATQIARILCGKHKPEYTPYMDMGDFVIVINCEKIAVTGNKLLQKKYFRHSKYVGSLKETLLIDMLKKHPERVITHAVKGMLPRNTIGRAMLKKLKVYSGSVHPHAAQSPQVYTL